MALHVKQGVFTAPTVNGTDTVISGLTDPKAIFLWTTMETAEGNVGADYVLCAGIGTFRGGAVSQRANSVFADDGAGTSACAIDYANDSILIGRTAQATVDFECDLVSMDADEVTLDWANAPAAAIKVHYFIIGGDSVLDALVGDFGIGANGTDQDETVVAGFGQPELLIWLNAARGSFSAGTSDCAFGIGAGFDENNMVEALLKQTNAAANVAMASYVRSGFGMSNFSGTTLDGHASLDQRIDWPTDGFRITKPDAYTLTNQVSYLALRLDTDVSVSVGRSETITGGSTVNLPGVADTDPKGLLLFHANVPLNESQDNSHADLGYIGIGGYDGTTEGHAGTGDDDGSTTAVGYRTHSESKALRMFSPSASGTLQAEADASFVAEDAVLTFTDLDSIARAFCWVMLAEAAAAAPDTTPHAIRTPYLLPSVPTQDRSRW